MLDRGKSGFWRVKGAGGGANSCARVERERIKVEMIGSLVVALERMGVGMTTFYIELLFSKVITMTAVNGREVGATLRIKRWWHS